MKNSMAASWSSTISDTRSRGTRQRLGLLAQFGFDLFEGGVECSGVFGLECSGGIELVGAGGVDEAYARPWGLSQR